MDFPSLFPVFRPKKNCLSRVAPSIAYGPSQSQSLIHPLECLLEREDDIHLEVSGAVQIILSRLEGRCFTHRVQRGFVEAPETTRADDIHVIDCAVGIQGKADGRGAFTMLTSGQSGVLLVSGNLFVQQRNEDAQIRG